MIAEAVEEGLSQILRDHGGVLAVVLVHTGIIVGSFAALYWKLRIGLAAVKRIAEEATECSRANGRRLAHAEERLELALAQKVDVNVCNRFHSDLGSVLDNLRAEVRSLHESNDRLRETLTAAMAALAGARRAE